MPERTGSTSTIYGAKKILIIRYRFLGDTILSVPFLRNLRRVAPQAKIDMLVGPVSGKVLCGCPYVDEFIEYDTTRFHKYDSGAGKTKSFWSYVFQLRKNHYDTVFVLKRSLSSAFLAYATGAASRIGYIKKTDDNRAIPFLHKGIAQEFLLSHKALYDEKIHEVDSVLSVLRAAGIEPEDDYLEAWISEEETRNVRAKVPELKAAAGKVLIHAAAAHPDKMYPLEAWAQIIARLDREYGLTPYFTGDRMDRAAYQRLAALSGVKSVNMAGELNVRESMALYKEMDLAICVDSGPAHLSCAVGVPTVTIFGPTDPVRWQPRGALTKSVFDETLVCRPCHYKKSCGDERQCLTALSPDKILDAAKQLLTRRLAATQANGSK